MQYILNSYVSQFYKVVSCPRLKIHNHFEDFENLQTFSILKIENNDNLSSRKFDARKLRKYSTPKFCNTHVTIIFYNRILESLNIIE